MARQVVVADSVYQVCLAHALMTEHEEVMGLLLGDTFEAGGGAGEEVRIWHSMTLRRSDKTPDRCEISPEQLSAAVSAAEEISEKLQLPTRVVGWYHSHPHITPLPSHVDLATQMQWQVMDRDFVGLIFSVFNAGTGGPGAPGTMRHQLLGFRAAERGHGELRQVKLHIRMLPLRDIASAVDHARYEAIGGSFHGEYASVATSRQGYDEIKEAYAEEREASKREAAGNQLAWLQLAGQYQARLGTFAAEEVCPLECSMRDREHNFDVLGQLARDRGEALRRCQSVMAEAEDTEEEEVEDVEEAAPTPDAAGGAQASAAGAERSVDAAGDKAALPGGPPIDVDNSQPSQQQRQQQPRQQQPPPEPRRRISKGQQPPRQSQHSSDAALAPNLAMCFALVQKGGVWRQCSQYPRKDVFYPDGTPFEYCHLHSFDDGKNYHPKCNRSLEEDELPEADDCVEEVPEQAGAAQEMVQLDYGTITPVGNVYVARRAKTGQEREFSVKEHGADAQSEAQMWLLCFNDGPQEPAGGSAGASGQLQDQAGEAAEPKRKVPRTG